MKDPLSLLPYNVPVTDGSFKISPAFFRVLTSVLKAVGGYATPDAIQPQTLAGSPWGFTATVPGQLLISGGTVSSVILTRRGTTITAPSSGLYLTPGDSVTVTYTVAPTVHFVPR